MALNEGGRWGLTLTHVVVKRVLGGVGGEELLPADHGRGCAQQGVYMLGKGLIVILGSTKIQLICSSRIRESFGML